MQILCFKCFLLNTIPQCHNDIFIPDTLLNSGVVHLKRAAKYSRIALAESDPWIFKSFFQMNNAWIEKRVWDKDISVTLGDSVH